MALKVKTDDCICCGACESECPAGAITVDDYAVIDADACLDCGACAQVCPKDAILVP